MLAYNAHKLGASMRYEKLRKKQTTNLKENATAEAIVCAATELFRGKGYLEVTTRDIATAAGVNLGLIPYYFGSKENLANLIYKRNMNELYHKALKTELGILSSVEKLYACSMLVWYFENSDTNYRCFKKFTCELLQSGGGGSMPSDEFVNLSFCVIQERDVAISRSKNDVYLTALAGSEQKMAVQMMKGELNTSYEDIMNIVISNYLYNIGFPDEDIAATIETGYRAYLRVISSLQ